MGRVVSPTPTSLSSGRVVPALVASYDMHGRAVGLFYTQPTGHDRQTGLQKYRQLLEGGREGGREGEREREREREREKGMA